MQPHSNRMPPRDSRSPSGIVYCVLLLLSTLAAADSLQTGPEFWIDGPIAVQPGIDRETPAVGLTPSGEAIVAWNAFGSFRNDIWLRRLDASGQTLGDPVQANLTAADDQHHPRLAVRPDGKILVIWQSEEIDGTLSGNPIRVWIRGRLFNSNLSPAADEILISSLSTDLEIDASADVAVLSNGTFAVSWESKQTLGNDDQSTSIQGRLVSSSGQTSGAQFQVNNHIDGGQRDPAIGPLHSGGFLVVWAGRSLGTDGNTSIQGRRFNNSAAPVGTDFQINTTVTGTQDDPDISKDTLGTQIVVWESPTTASSRKQIFARFLDSSGTPTSTDLQMHATDLVNHQLGPRVTSPDAGRFLVSWFSDTTTGDDPDQSVQARGISDSGLFVTPQFQVNDGRLADQQDPDVAGGSGRVTVVYHDVLNPFVSSDDGIVARNLDFCLFCDGFETGDTDGWTSSSP